MLSIIGYYSFLLCLSPKKLPFTLVILGEKILVSTFVISISSEKLHLLDVGSCFNPFSVYHDFYSVAIDLQPAASVSKLLMFI